eukprot:TRINITY_DN11325_c0_g1_i1.p1 TRINITY_DN11325_c0_g1~~TRINITY_DN11325_c0_g1_i1.p1  ORF type:complete len:181 (-),score=53.22 TRINITY_DN11325_c0_g1_i1:20-514(-)
MNKKIEGNLTEISALKYEREVLLGNQPDLALVQAQVTQSGLSIPILEQTMAKKTKEVETFKNMIAKLKKNCERISTETTKLTTTFEAIEYRKLILELRQKGILNEIYLKSLVEKKLSTMKAPAKGSGAPAKKTGAPAKKTAVPAKKSAADAKKTAWVPKGKGGK